MMEMISWVANSRKIEEEEREEEEEVEGGER